MDSVIGWESSGLIHAHSANSSVTQKNRQVVARRMIGPDWMRQISVMRFHDVVFFWRSLCQMSHDRPVRMHQIVSVAVNRSWLTGAYLLAFWILRAMVAFACCMGVDCLGASSCGIPSAVLAQYLNRPRTMSLALRLSCSSSEYLQVVSVMRRASFWSVWSAMTAASSGSSSKMIAFHTRTSGRLSE